MAAVTNQHTDQNPNYRGLELPAGDDGLHVPVRERMARHYVERITESRDPWTSASDDSWETAPAQYTEFVERDLVAAVTMSDELERDFRQAWLRWWGAERTEHLARPIQTLIEGLRIGISQHLYDGAYTELMNWFRLMDIPGAWESRGEYVRWMGE